MKQETIDRTATHGVGPNLPCEPDSLAKVDEPWRETLRFLWGYDFDTAACCAGHEGTTAEVFLAWDGYPPEEGTLLELAHAALMECEFNLDWQILAAAPRHGTYLSWSLQASCPETEKGWTSATLKMAQVDIEQIRRQFKVELLKKRHPEVWEEFFFD